MKFYIAYGFMLARKTSFTVAASEYWQKKVTSLNKDIDNEANE